MTVGAETVTGNGADGDESIRRRGVTDSQFYTLLRSPRLLLHEADTVADEQMTERYWRRGAVSLQQPLDYESLNSAEIDSRMKYILCCESHKKT